MHSAMSEATVDQVDEFVNSYYLDPRQESSVSSSSEDEDVALYDLYSDEEMPPDRPLVIRYQDASRTPFVGASTTNNKSTATSYDNPRAVSSSSAKQGVSNPASINSATSGDPRGCRRQFGKISSDSKCEGGREK